MFAHFQFIRSKVKVTRKKLHQKTWNTDHNLLQSYRFRWNTHLNTLGQKVTAKVIICLTKKLRNTQRMYHAPGGALVKYSHETTIAYAILTDICKKKPKKTKTNTILLLFIIIRVIRSIDEYSCYCEICGTFTLVVNNARLVT